jgi:TolB-like protein/Flp pilus assembly protein TadD
MSFLGEIKRRKIFQVAAVYAVVAWLIVQVVTSIETPLNLPDWVDTLVIVLLAIGFPITLVMSWGLNLTPDGLVKEDAEAPARRSNLKIEYVLFGLIALALGWLVYRVEFDGSKEVAQATTPVEQVTEKGAAELPSDVLPNSIAVLPFDNLSLDPDNAYFAAGIHGSTLSQLAKIRDLVVLSRSSVLQYAENRPPIAEIAKALKVETVMEGSVRYANGRVVITAQLIDGKTDAHLWSDEFNRELTDVFAVQAEVAEHIATAMQVQLMPEEKARIGNRPTASTEAYQHYLHALSLPDTRIYPEYIPLRIESLKRAIAADPGFAEAYSDLAMAYYSRRDLDMTIEAAQKAIELAPSLGAAHLMLGVTLGNYFARQGDARAAFLRAIDFGPNDPESLIIAARNLVGQDLDYADAVRLGNRAIAIEPNSAFLYTWLGFINLDARDLMAAAESMKVAIRLDPGSYEHFLNLAIVEYMSGDPSAVKENLDRAVALMSSGATYRVDYIAYLYGLLGDTDRATELLARYEQAIGETEGSANQSQSPLVWAVLGTRDKERSLQAWTKTVNDYLEQGLPVSPRRIYRFRDNWLDDPMLEEPEFLGLRRRLGFKG